MTGPGVNPYKGLRAFDETDAADFFGRDRLTRELIDHLAVPDNRLLAVVGPSGSGKSSVVRAGLLPALRAGAIDGSSGWFTTTMIPGAHPFEALETALLRVAVNPPSALLEQLQDGDRGILRSIKRTLPDDGSSVTVVIDQFEELFTASTAAERDQFLRCIAVAATDPSTAVRFVITLRADFYDHPLRHPEFAPLLKSHTVVVTPLAPDEIRQAITMPALAAGVEFEPGLVAEIVADVHDEPGTLPLLQYALGRVFDAAKDDRTANVISTETYASIGGVTGAIGGRAEELWGDLDANGQGAARRLFGRLVTLGEGIEDTRRRVLRAELGHDEATELAIDGFTSARLLTLDRQAVTREPTVEIAHEALIREWPRLKEWLEDDRDDLRVHRHLTSAATSWDQDNRDPAELYRGGRLETAESLLQDGNVGLNATEREFVQASAAARDLSHAQERRRVRRLKRLVAVVAVVAAVALTASVLAVVQRNRADDLAVEADVERMAAIARQSDPLDPTIAILLAVEAHRADSSDATLDAVHRALTGRSAYLGQLVSDQVWGITALDDGVRVVTNTSSNIDIWNVETRTREASWPVDVGVGIGGVLAPINVDGELVYIITPYFSTAATDGTVAAAMADKRLSIVDLSNGATSDLELAASGTALAMSSNGTHLAVGTIDGRVQMFETDDLSSPLWTSQHDSFPSDLQWAPDDKSLASGHGSGEISMFSLESGDPVWTFEGHAEWVSPAADARGLLFSADGQRLVVLRQDQELITRSADVRNAESTLDISGYGQVVQEFDPSTGAPLSDPMPVLGDEISLRWADRSQTAVLATGARSNLRVYDLARSGEPRSLSEEGRGEGGASAALLDLDVVVTANRTGMSLHSIRGSDAVSTLIPLSPRQALGDPYALRMMAFDDDTNVVATTLFDFFPPLQQPERFDLDDPASEPSVMADFAGAEFANAAIGFGPTVMMVSLVNGVEARRGLDGESYGPARPIFGAGGGQAALSPNGEREIAWGGGADGALLLFDTATGEVVADLSDLVGDDITWLHFSTDSTRLDIYSGRSGYVFDGVTGELIWAREETGAIISGPGGEYYAVTDGQATIQLLDQTTREPVGDPYIGHAAEIFNLNFNTDGSLLSSRSADGTVRVWSTESRRQLGGEIDAFAANGVVKWSPDGRLMAYPEVRGMRVWNYDTDSWPDIACEVAGRNLTIAEWDEFGPRTVDYRATCDQYDEAAS